MSPDGAALFGKRDPLADEAVHVRVFLVEVQVEVELERLRRPGRLQRIVYRHGLVQGGERRVERSVILLVGRVHVRRDRLQQRGDHRILAVRVPLQHLVQEAEALDRGRQTRLAAGRLERRRVDERDVVSERVVDCEYCVDRTGHVILQW